MSEKRDPPFDPDATERLGAKDFDPDATLTGPPEARTPGEDPADAGAQSDPKTAGQPADQPFDPDATLQPVPPAFDPDKTLQPVPPAFDPDTTLQPVPQAYDPDATVGITRKRRRRANPFAPRALPEALQANLAALGGLNPLIAFANPVFGVLPEIRAAQTHPDPGLLKETLQDLIEAFEAGATAAHMTGDTIEAALYALCCLADDSAAATPWGADWLKSGLLERMRAETTGGEGFFAQLEEMSRNPERNAELLEFLYICIALGFEGRYRNAENGAADLDRVRRELHALIVRRRPRPMDGLSERWRGVTTVAVAATPAEKMPWRLIGSAVVGLFVLIAVYQYSRAPAPQPEAGSPALSTPASGGATTAPAVSPAALPAVPPASPTAAPLAAPLAAPSAAPSAAPPASSRAAPPASPTLKQVLADAVGSGLVTLSETNNAAIISIRNDAQFAEAGVEPEAAVRPIVEKIAALLDAVPGTILVIGHADNLPINPRLHISNSSLSRARAETVARLLASKLRDPQRVKSQGAGASQPVAPNDTDQNRARNRRVEIHLIGPAVKAAGAGA